LPEPTNVREKDKVVFVNDKGQSTMPLFVKRRISTEDGQIQLYGSWDRFPWSGSGDDLKDVLYPTYRGRMFNESDARNRDDGYGCGISCGSDKDNIILTGKEGNNLTTVGKTVFVPNGFKVIKINKDDIDSWLLSEDKYDRKERKRKPTADELASPQTLADIEMQLFKSGMCEEVQTVTDGIEWWLRFNGKQSRSMSKLAALSELVIRHDLREKAARDLLKLASRNGSPKYIIKRAQPSAPAFPEPQIGTDPSLGNVPVIYPQTDNIPANEGGEDRKYGDNYMDMEATYRAEQAAQTGQKEVLDTSVITGLVKSMDPDQAVDQFISDLMLGLDRVGRILFMYYWHFDKFKERYGQQDMPELEDNLRNVFENLGDLTLFLKQKTIEPDVSDANAEAELDSVI